MSVIISVKIRYRFIKEIVLLPNWDYYNNYNKYWKIVIKISNIKFTQKINIKNVFLILIWIFIISIN